MDNVVSGEREKLFGENNRKLFGETGRILCIGLKCTLCGYEGSFGYVGTERELKIGRYSNWKHVFVCPRCDERFVKEEETSIEDE